MNAHSLNQRITVQQKSVTRAANGAEIPAWIPYAAVSHSGDGKLWARVEPIRGREFFAAAQMQGAVDYRVTVRYTPAIQRDMRVLWGSIVLDITAEPINVNAANRWTELMCISGVRDG